MAPTTRSSAKKTAAAADEGGSAAASAEAKKTNKKQQKTKANSAKQDKQQQQEEEEDAPLPFGSRIVIIVLTSFVAEKIWRYRSVVSAGWYSDKQSAIEQAMITGFEYTILMGLLFFLGILISVATVSVQKKIWG